MPPDSRFMRSAGGRLAVQGERRPGPTLMTRIDYDGVQIVDTTWDGLDALADQLAADWELARDERDEHWKRVTLEPWPRSVASHGGTMTRETRARILDRLKGIVVAVAIAWLLVAVLTWLLK